MVLQRYFRRSELTMLLLFLQDPGNDTYRKALEMTMKVSLLAIPNKCYPEMAATCILCVIISSLPSSLMGVPDNSSWLNCVLTSNPFAVGEPQLVMDNQFTGLWLKVLCTIMQAPALHAELQKQYASSGSQVMVINALIVGSPCKLWMHVGLNKLRRTVCPCSTLWSSGFFCCLYISCTSGALDVMVLRAVSYSIMQHVFSAQGLLKVWSPHWQSFTF